MSTCDHAQNGDYCDSTNTQTYELDGRHYDLCDKHAPTNQDPITEPEFQ